jgi:hypothetical protein
MEQSGRNRWQRVANGMTRERLKLAKTVAAGCGQLPIGDGKEGVDGSSPSEGFSTTRHLDAVPMGVHSASPCRYA